MAFISKIIYLFLIFAFFIGQIFRINIFNVSFPLIDIAIVLFSLFNIVQHIKNKTLKTKNKAWLYFLIFTWIFLIFNLFKYQISSLTPVFYLTRLTCLLSLFIFPPKIKYQKFIYLAIIANIIFGLIQYILWPNFTYFDVLNWDPHLFRLVSTFFDPTFTALIYLIFIASLFLNKKIPYRIPLLIISYLAMALTYSRSTYLSFLLVFTFIAFKSKKIKIFLISLLLITSTILMLPRQPGEGTKLERTSSIEAKIENYKEAWQTFKKSPLIGHGYNNISFIRENKNPDSHSNSAFDGSLITLLATTGIIGTSLFLWGIKTLYLKSNLTKQSILIAILFHSIFANSLLYPWVLLLLVIL
jgi:O-antigen ligase/polysaccharide polymerase Wzy-like membrane protein